jgi:hypothetical protein
MFIKIHVKNSVDKLIPIMVNANLICTIEPMVNGETFLVFHDQRTLIVVEDFQKIVAILRTQGIFEV